MNYLTLLFATAISEPEKLWNYKLQHFLSRIRDRGSHSWSVNRFDWNAKGQYASCDVFGIGRSRSYVRYGFWTTDKKNHRADTTWPPSTYVVSYVVGNSFNKFVGSNLEDGAALFWELKFGGYFLFLCAWKFYPGFCQTINLSRADFSSTLNKDGIEEPLYVFKYLFCHALALSAQL